MSEFLMIVPDGWTEPADIEALLNNGGANPDEVSFWISQESWGDIETMLSNAVALPEGKHVMNAKIFRTDTGYRFWVLFG